MFLICLEVSVGLLSISVTSACLGLLNQGHAGSSYYFVSVIGCWSSGSVSSSSAQSGLETSRFLQSLSLGSCFCVCA